MKRIVILTALLLLAIIGAKAHNSISNTIKPKTKKGTGIKVAANVQDSLALVALYNSTDGPNWTNNTNWLIGEVEDWWGIILDVGGRCEEVCLPGNNLFGTIPSEIGDLNNLIILNFASNNLSGNIPIEVWNLTNLTKLILRYNSFEGNVPSEIGNLFNLINLELLDNNLTGIIPTETWSLTNLTRLDLGNNNFEGTIPPEIGNLTNLTSLNLSRNNLSGYIPIEIGDLSNLTYLALNINNISGNIPSEIKNLTNLRFLYLGWNNLSGNIPSGIGNLTNLEYLDLSLANLTGTIPDEIGNLTNLFSLSLYQNQLSGSIPIQIGNLTNIVHLRLDGNNLTGSIPTDIGNLIKLSNINLSSNSLSGIIPSEIGNLTQTKSLRLNNNELADLPDLSNLINLESLYIQINKFQFDDLENCGVDFSSLDKVYYSPQDTLILTKIENPDNVIISVNCGGSNNQYQWYKNDELLTGETQSSLTVSKTDEGFYSCIIKDSNYPSLILKTNKEIVGNITCGVFESEYNALATLYNSNGGNDWFNKTNWMSLEPVNDWYGVTVENFHVKNISLSNNNLSGNLPVEISNLTNLDYLSLGNNSITGNLPVGFGNLINITQLYIGNNNFEGSISNEISQLINLKALDISFNNYNILVDISLLINLKFLRVNDNNFEFDDLNTLGIDWSNMNSGSIYSPQDTIQLLKQLSGENVILSVVCGGINNQYKWYKDGLEIVGETQNSLTVDNTKNAYYYCTVQNSNFPNLEIRSESGSTGSIICGIYEIEYNALIEIYNSTNGDNWLNKANWKSNEHVNNWYGITVENFQVAKIELNSNNLSGNIPNQIGNISNLKVLSLGWNKITGSIPNEIGNLNNLNIFNINYNNFTGSIPAEIGNLTNLEYLTIRSTNISGNIPSEIGNLINLKGLCLDRNNLTGNIPLEIFNLINLNYIYISNNNLTGSIPVEISNLKNITNLEFNNNLFNGLPNMSSLTMLDYLTVYDNNFQFEDFDNIGIDLSGISTWQYSPQSNITLSKADNGVSVTLSVNCNSSNNQYQWYKDNIEIIGEINKT
ncbi:MAG: hypothetical protein GY756_11020, partial [bacterium]|nr:hypothetical protein [bacterium]